MPEKEKESPNPTTNLDASVAGTATVDEPKVDLSAISDDQEFQSASVNLAKPGQNSSARSKLTPTDSASTKDQGTEPLQVEEASTSEAEMSPPPPPVTNSTTIPQPAPKSKKPLIVVLTAVIVLALLGGGVWWFVANQTTDEDNGGITQPEPEPQPVDDSPSVEINSLTTEDSTPVLTGTVDDSDTSVVVRVNDQEYQAEVDENGNWQAAVTETLLAGVYNIEVVATDLDGNETRETLSNGLIIEAAMPEPEPAPEPEPEPEPAPEPEPVQTPVTGPEEGLPVTGPSSDQKPRR